VGAVRPAQASPQPFADDKGATALMLIFAPAPAGEDLRVEGKLLERVELAPDALEQLALQRARTVTNYLLGQAKIAGERISESTRGTGSKGSRVYLWLE